jgi:mannose-6-phosphate isomerase-like protein (cupin superfamily)
LQLTENRAMATRKTAPAQAAPKAGAKKPAAAVKTAAAKKAAPARKPVAAKKAAAPKAPARAKAAPKPGKPPKVVWKPQTFMASHLKDALFKTGLRSYAAYRELGVENATGGAVQAHVIRLLGKCDPKVVSIPHYHGVQFQFLYMLKGWMIGEYEGAGRVKMSAGSCWIQPPGIRHQVIDYSDGCEMIEIILPAQFATVEL